YVNALTAELAMRAGDFEGRRLSSVYIGGGTPSSLDEGAIAEIMRAVRENYVLGEDAEITIEVNPCTATAEKLREYREAGVNRISFGVQSADDRVLKNLGRLHDFRRACEAFSLAREAGFENISLDLMYALPGQTPESLRDTLERFLELDPEHISAYSLILEEGTPFFEMYGRGKGDGFAPLPSEEEEEAMYSLADGMLEAAGFRRYEISNYAKPGFESRHNTLYWRRDEYLGVGLGAASLVKRADTETGKEIRYKNTTDLDAYISFFTGLAGSGDPDGTVPERMKAAGLYEEAEELSLGDEMAEFMFLGLRMTEGVSREWFESTFGQSLDSVYGDVVEKYAGLGLIESEGDCVRLTKRGFRLSNTVFAEMI
ncbi:MAG: radical SAM family heme chaperone HemW, partial [Lachnospiraceae bacterium]|nr:radical SAM family heme chaperone HemW [Lachnospiraceae bacterium]